jgi:hypothetical protein
MAPSESVLDLSTLVDRPVVTIDRERYELRHPDELSLLDQLRMTRSATRVQVLVGLLTDVDRAPTPAEEDEYRALLDQTCRAILVAPDAVHAKLRDDHRVAIGRAFTQLQSAKNRQLAGAGAQPAVPETNDAPTTGAS